MSKILGLSICFFFCVAMAFSQDQKDVYRYLGHDKIDTISYADLSKLLDDYGKKEKTLEASNEILKLTANYDYEEYLVFNEGQTIESTAWKGGRIDLDKMVNQAFKRRIMQFTSNLAGSIERHKKIELLRSVRVEHLGFVYIKIEKKIFSEEYKNKIQPYEIEILKSIESMEAQDEENLVKVLKKHLDQRKITYKNSLKFEKMNGEKVGFSEMVNLLLSADKYFFEENLCFLTAILKRSGQTMELQELVQALKIYKKYDNLEASLYGDAKSHKALKDMAMAIFKVLRQKDYESVEFELVGILGDELYSSVFEDKQERPRIFSGLHGFNLMRNAVSF